MKPDVLAHFPRAQGARGNAPQVDRRCRLQSHLGIGHRRPFLPCPFNLPRASADSDTEQSSYGMLLQAAVGRAADASRILGELQLEQRYRVKLKPGKVSVAPRANEQLQGVWEVSEERDRRAALQRAAA